MSATAEAPQHLQALAVANRIRLERAHLLGGLGGLGRRGSRKIPPERIAELLLDPPEVLLGMRVDRLLARTERYRWVRVANLLQQQRISETRLVRDLTERQRVALAERLVGGKR